MNITDQNQSDQNSEQEQSKRTWVAPEFIENFVENTKGGYYDTYTHRENSWYHS
jgi:hypothetical protein